MRSRLEREALLDLITRCLREGSAIEIDGMGDFQLEDERVVFRQNQRPRVFLAYADEDRPLVHKLYECLQAAEFEPWMDEAKLLPGQNWPRAIDRAIELSDFFIGCFSKSSSAKRGHFQCELRYALDIAESVPLEDVFLLPVRLEECEVPRRVSRNVQYVDLFPNWERGVRKLIATMQRHVLERERLASRV